MSVLLLKCEKDIKERVNVLRLSVHAILPLALLDESITFVIFSYNRYFFWHRVFE